MSSSNNGTAAGTGRPSVSHQRKFFEGTYAARVKFTDAPVRGPDGDHVVQTFFTITPLNADHGPRTTASMDFEYLPNGGWGEPANIMYATTWETYQQRAVGRRSTSTTSSAPATTAGTTWCSRSPAGRVRYYVDGALFADHGDSYYPETPMSINFNLWFISGGLVGQPGHARLPTAGRLGLLRQERGGEPGPGHQPGQRLPYDGHDLEGHRPQPLTDA